MAPMPLITPALTAAMARSCFWALRSASAREGGADRVPSGVRCPRRRGGAPPAWRAAAEPAHSARRCSREHVYAAGCSPKRGRGPALPGDARVPLLNRALPSPRNPRARTRVSDASDPTSTHLARTERRGRATAQRTPADGASEGSEAVRLRKQDPEIHRIAYRRPPAAREEPSRRISSLGVRTATAALVCMRRAIATAVRCVGVAKRCRLRARKVWAPSRRGPLARAAVRWSAARGGAPRGGRSGCVAQREVSFGRDYGLAWLRHSPHRVDPHPGAGAEVVCHRACVPAAQPGTASGGEPWQMSIYNGRVRCTRRLLPHLLWGGPPPCGRETASTAAVAKCTPARRHLPTA
jgi:hypothetical protein